MSTTKYFIVRELVRLRRKITKLERGLETHAPDDPQTAGQREILENEYRNRQLLMDLVAYAMDPTAFLMECRMRYTRAERRHEEATGRSAFRGTHSQQDWWSTLGQMQYLVHLIHGMEQVLHDGSEADLKREMEAFARNNDVSALLENSAILHAMARAESSVADRAALAG